jgi:exocyst complex component 2
MANVSDAELLGHYKLTTLFPDEWPKEKNQSSDEEDEPPSRSVRAKNAKIARRKSKYYALERNSSNRSSVPGAQRSDNGVENLVQKDEPDPLGAFPSVVYMLRQRGLPVEEDLKLSS